MVRVSVDKDRVHNSRLELPDLHVMSLCLWYLLKHCSVRLRVSRCDMYCLGFDTGLFCLCKSCYLSDFQVALVGPVAGFLVPPTFPPIVYYKQVVWNHGIVPFLLDPLTEARWHLLLIPGHGRDAVSPYHGPDLSHFGHAYCSILVYIDFNHWQHITTRIIIVVIIYDM